ncbi:NUDIX hydrolase [Oscillatoria sp. FACHB-1406]|uniref:NUDIX domain-containing protein n=1 Tax=Oscillatoria sp. FACHB-1406 TaxID=2692846 RepID=UPI0016853583|nr:NUDIX hydrolase [Oscillatoria sp. FACHB-1406]MBD2579955.1 NUDIX hydrolase [Oscillatoria sp. FACHB-1406]
MKRDRIQIDDSWYQRPLGVRESISAGGIIAREDSGTIYIAAVREASKVKNAAYVLPKGRLEAGETIEEAARREIAEEAGLTDLTLLAELGILERLDFRKRSWKIIHYFLYRTAQIEGKPTDTTIDYQLHWFPLDELPPFFWPEQRQLIEKNMELIRESLKRDR